MLKPAILFKDELERKFEEQMYTQDFFYYTGFDGSTFIPEIKEYFPPKRFFKNLST